MHHKFVWHTQVFWCRECPRRWAPVQRILFEAAGAEEPQHLRQEDEDQGPGKRTRTELPRALVGGSAADAGAWADFPPGSWWFECSTTLMPSDCTMLVEWRPEATYHYCSREREALVVIHQDGSTMETFKVGLGGRKPDRQGGRAIEWGERDADFRGGHEQE